MKTRGAAVEGGIKGRGSKRIPLLWRGRIHFARWFGFKSAGTNPWHEVLLCWSFSPKFIHQLFTVNADCISVGNYEGWVFSLRQKECDTADTPRVMRRTQCPRSVRGKNYLCIRKHIILSIWNKVQWVQHRNMFSEMRLRSQGKMNEHF